MGEEGCANLWGGMFCTSWAEPTCFRLTGEALCGRDCSSIEAAVCCDASRGEPFSTGGEDWPDASSCTESLDSCPMALDCRGC